jgi:hypothetical protein
MNLASDACPPRVIERAGLDWLATIEAGGLGLVRAETFKGGFYEPSPTGQPLWVAPVFYGQPSRSNLADIVAWSPADPGRWWRRTGNGMLLGFANVQKARQTVWDFGYSEPPPPPTLTLHQTPRDYVRAGFDGACFLDWTYGPGELEGVERVICEGLDFAEQVERALCARSPQPPAVLVSERMEAA